MKVKQTALVLSLFLLALANFYLWQFIFRGEGNLKVVFFDVGQGDAIFIETFQGHQILIDGGPSVNILNKLGQEMPFWDRTLDLIILTHPDADHLRGLNYVLRRYRVENILWNGVEKDTKTFEYWKENLKKEKQEGGREVIARAGQKIKAGQTHLFVIYPFKSLEGEFYEKGSNETSVVVQLVFGKNEFLFTGDITTNVKEEILAAEINLASDVLKVAHHGSRSSNSKKFLEKVAPEIAVISCGKNNPYGHPYQEVLRNLEEFAIKVLRTDQQGDIKIFSDGENLKIKNYGVSTF